MERASFLQFIDQAIIWVQLMAKDYWWTDGWENIDISLIHLTKYTTCLVPVNL